MSDDEHKVSRARKSAEHSELSTQNSALSYLYGLGNEVTAMKLGLDSVRLLLGRLGDPHERFRSVIVAGTNGKGSIAATLESILRRAGLRTGLYTSPHLVAIEERVRVGGREVTRERFAGLAARVRVAAEALVADGVLPALPTFFEHLTAIAFLEFAEARVDIAVLEVGLGGRLDATNVVQPIVAAIGPVAFDHKEYLGETLAEIAAEKAAVIKPGCAAVIGPQPVEALDVLLRRCLECDVLPAFTGEPRIYRSEGGRFTFGYETETDVYEQVTLGLRGRHQIANALVAIHAAEALRRAGFAISRGAILDGIARTEWPGRLEMIPGPPPILLDGAHNAAGAATLRAFLDEFGRAPVTLVFGAMGDKDVGAMLETLAPAASTIVLTRPDSPRALAPEALAAALPLGSDPVLVESVDDALVHASNVTPREGSICVAGSLYLVGEAKSVLANRPPVPNAEKRP
jgi:dihydrofolate synthase / folylpolyglutamate synthase